MTITRKAGTPQDLLALIPVMLGYTPTNSVVLLPMRAGRTIGAMRFDLPTDDEVPEFSRTAVGYVARVPDADAVILATYGASDRGLYEWLRDQFPALGIQVVAAMYVTDSHWGDYIADTIGDLDEITPEVIEGVPVADGNQDSGAVLPAVPPAHQGVTPIDTEEQHWAMLALIEHLLTGTGELSPGQLAGFMAYLERPALRDTLVVWAVGGEAQGHLAMEAQMDFESGTPYPKELAQYMWGAGIKPEPARLERLLDIARQTAAARPEPGALSICAWASWALGRSSHALSYAQQGQALEPDHGLCGIVAMFVDGGHLPDWAFTR